MFEQVKHYDKRLQSLTKYYKLQMCSPIIYAFTKLSTPFY